MSEPFTNIPCVYANWRGGYLCTHPEKESLSVCEQYKATCEKFEAELIDLYIESIR